MWEVYLLMFVVVAVVSFLWVNGITNVHKNHPNLKGDKDGWFDFDTDTEDITQSLWGKDREDYDEN